MRDPAGRYRVLCVVGARPNFMKTVPVIRELSAREMYEPILVHTGQHYDEAMSTIFFEELGVGAPDHLLGVGSGSHAVQTARVMERLEPVLLAEQPDFVFVPGDVNSTIAAALVASKLQIPVGHLEAGLRSFDRTMPEELNRILTDQLSDLLFIHSPEARDNLLRENVNGDAIHAVGNTMIDTLVAMRNRIDGADAARRLGVHEGRYLVVTLHRPALVDTPLLADAILALERIGSEIPVVFPCHPRTRARLATLGVQPASERVRLTEPLGYLDFLGLVAHAGAVLTDSGGIQEETTFLGIPCFTLRDNTERPVTCEIGTNVLLGLRPERILELPALIQGRDGRNHPAPDGWDGAAAARVVDVLDRYLTDASERAPDVTLQA
ncbi:MAG TPA: UDP-N-acetylglucosamine 2-epimerase (non-hydrolyzing) [Solirubrobacteraceae bacterium]|nr:UDP-N-acetylglucosamine 2-epimerase (non-hydrolyzing) [Solirubrobacteraceae bacterium]